MTETADKSLNPKAVQTANSKFYAQHPEMKGQAIDLQNPSHKAYIRAWQSFYQEASEKTEKKKKAIQKSAEKKKQESKKTSPPPFTDKPVGSATQLCPNSTTTPTQQSIPPPNNPPCNVNVESCEAKIKIECSHQAGRLGKGKLLEVVPDAVGGDKVKLIASTIGGCGKPVSWKISGLTSEEKIGNQQSLTVQPLPYRHMGISPLSRWAMKAAPMTYRVQPRLECGSLADSYTIKAYPGEQFSVKITPQSWGLYKKLEDGINTFCDWVFGEKRLNIIMPQGSISINAQWKEHTDYQAFYFFEIVIALDPLFGVTGRIPLLDALRAINVPSKVIDWVRRYLGDILYLAAEGKMGASGHLQRVSPDNYSNWSGQGKGEIIFKIGAELGKSDKTLTFNASGESGISLVLQLDSYKKDPTDKLFKSDLLFSGLKSKISIEIAGGWLSFEEEYQLINARAIFSNHQLTIFD